MSCALARRGQPSPVEVYHPSAEEAQLLHSPARTPKEAQGPFLGEVRVMNLPKLQTHPSEAVHGGGCVLVRLACLGFGCVGFLECSTLVVEVWLVWIGFWLGNFRLV